MLPNILLMHCHDLGDLIGPYPGNSAQTPHLNRLASEGVVFENYFAAAPTCSPSRGSMISGLTPHRNGLMALASGGHWELSPDLPTLPQRLANLGYATASFGIWHVSQDFTPFGVATGNQDAVCETVTTNALDYLNQRPTDRPFFLMLGFREPHRPFMDVWPDPPDPETVALPGYLLDALETRGEMSQFYAEVSRMDASVGQILAYLREQKLEDETIVVFTSDHGIAMPLVKGTLYDPGLKIPLIIRWPGQIQGGRRCSSLTSNVDLFPTLLEAIGEAEQIPADLDGQSLWPFVAQNEIVGHEALFAEQTWHDFYEPIRSIRTDRYKLIRNFETGRGLQIAADILPSPTVDVMREDLRTWPHPDYELYDLQADPLERRNLSGQPEVAAIEADLKTRLETWLRQTNDPIMDGVVPAPVGYWEHFCAKPAGPGALPPAKGEQGWVTVRWPPSATEHRCAGQ